jgi:hypothetical protein
MSTRVRVNPFEIALWILGVVLLVGGVGGALWASGVTSQGYSCSGADCSAPANYALAQALYMMAPPSVTAGLVAIVLSVGLRAALVGIARRAAGSDASTAELEGPQILEVVSEQAFISEASAAGVNDGAPARLGSASFAPPQFRPRRSVDHSAFKRPSAD